MYFIKNLKIYKEDTLPTTQEITLTINEQVNQINDRIIDLSEQLPQLLSGRKYSEAKLTIDSMLVLLNVLERLNSIENELAKLPDLLTSLTQSTKEIIKLETHKVKTEKTKPPKDTLEQKPQEKVIEKKTVQKLETGKEKKIKKQTSRRGRPSKEVLAMAERLPRHEQKDFYFPILEVLQENNGSQTGSLTIMGIKAKFGEKLLPGDYEIIGSNKAPRWQVVARWAQNKLKQLGFLTSLERGIWAITDTGKALLSGQIKLTPEQIDKLKEPIKLS